MLTSMALMVLGLLVLWLGSDLTVSCSDKTAWRIKISPVFVGLTLVSFGTSLPEITVSVVGAFDKLGGIETSGIVIGDALGSYFNQITFIVGFVAIFGSIHFPKKVIRREGAMLISSLILFALVSMDSVISRLEGLILILAYAIYLIIIVKSEIKADIPEEVERLGICWRWSHTPLIDALLLISGLGLTILASTMVVGSAIDLAEFLNVDPLTIGIIVVGLGTGLPELAVSLNATRKGNNDISIGNLIGSNITDIVFSVGVGASISGFNVDPGLISFDLPWLFLAAFIFIILGGIRSKIDRKASFILIFLFATYIGLKLIGLP